VDIRVKRIYQEYSQDDGFRVLVDRLWPRGISKEAARLDLWLKELGPSNELRKWFGHTPARWNEFKARYFQELEQRPDLVEQIVERAKVGPVTLLYSAKDTNHNQAVALKEFVEAFESK